MTVAAAVADAAFSGANGRIAYKRAWTGGPGTFWSSRPDGTRQRRLIRHATSLNFSASGRRVVFTRAGGIGLARATGRDRSWLLGSAPREGDPYWGVDWAALSPDGTQIAFNVPGGYGANTYVIGTNGANGRLLAEHADGPVFSPDGTRIAYIKNLAPGESESPGQAIETVAVDGSDRRTLIRYVKPSVVVTVTYPGRVDFAPDGTRLAVVEHGYGGPALGRIAIIDVKTRERTRLPARVTGSVLDAVWSPDGRWIAYVNKYSNRVFTIRPDGSGKRLAFTVRGSSPSSISTLAWQPRP